MAEKAELAGTATSRSDFQGATERLQIMKRDVSKSVGASPNICNAWEVKSSFTKHLYYARALWKSGSVVRCCAKHTSRTADRCPIRATMLYWLVSIECAFFGMPYMFLNLLTVPRLPGSTSSQSSEESLQFDGGLAVFTWRAPAGSRKVERMFSLKHSVIFVRT